MSKASPIVLAAALFGVLTAAGCTQPAEYRGANVTSAPARGPVPNESPQSGQPSMSAGSANIVSAPARGPVANESPSAGQPSMMGTPGRITSAPANGPVANESPSSGQPSRMLRPR